MKGIGTRLEAMMRFFFGGSVSRGIWLVMFCLPFGTVCAQYFPNMDYGPKRELAPGVTWQTATHASPAWSIQIFEIDMTNPNIELVPIYKAAGNVSGSANETTSRMAARSDAIAAVNAGYFTTDGTRLTNSFTLIDGQFIGGSGTLMRPENNRSVLGFSGDAQRTPKRTKLSNAFEPADPEDWHTIVDAIGGRGHFVTSDGVLVTQDNEGTTTSHYGNRHPRTAIGYSANPYRAWLVTVDGRQTGFSVGMTYFELGRLMADLGIEQSISLDGGGSTTAWVRGEGVVNSVSGGSERGVVSAWGVVPATTMDNSLEDVAVSGTWSTDISHPERYHLDYLISHDSVGPASVTWTPDLERSGFYHVYAWWASGMNRALAAPYRIDHYFGRTTVAVNQRENGGQWNLLGTHSFEAGTSGSVTLENRSPGTVSADAVRFVYLHDDTRIGWNPATWTTVAFDDFGPSDPIAFNTLVKDPSNEVQGNSRWQRNFSYTDLLSPSIPVPEKGNGVVLRTSANNFSPAEEQVLYQTFGTDDVEDVAVEALLLGYLADVNTAGSTTWGGIGVRMSDDFQNGYFIQHRVDDSASFGSYVNFYRMEDGDTDFLGRYYFRVGTGGVAQGELNDSRAIRSPQEAATNQWVRVRLEALGDTIALFLEDLEKPVAVFTDPDPIMGGKPLLFHEDPFGGSLTTPADSSGTFFEYFQVDYPGTPAPDQTPRIQNLVFLEDGGVRVELTAVPDATYSLEASSDLISWVPLSGAHVANAQGELTVEDPDGKDRRFWRLLRED